MINELYNNKRAYDTLVSLAKDGRFPHAVLIEGENSDDKKDFAKRLSQAVFCKENDKPCGKCADCHKVLTDNHPDILIYGQEGGNKSFHIDIIREIKLAACVLPNESEKKIYILSDAQNMTVQAQNALLKLIEEPPNHCIFILTCDNKSKLLETIISRVMVISLDNGLGIEVSEEITADGDAIIIALGLRDIYSCMKILLKYEKNRDGTLILLGVIRQAIASDITEFYLSDKAEQKFTALQGMRIADIIDRAEKYITQNVNMTLLGTYVASQLKIALA